MSEIRANSRIIIKGDAENPSRVGIIKNHCSMKRFALLLAVAFVIGLSACNKEKDCKCTTVYSGPGSEMFDDVTTTFTTEEECSEGNSETTQGDMSVKTTCEEE